ncbi:MAG: flagellar protein FliT [Sideroxydans sp.]|nr:flagellar protein FliT [Sideroxydans sp.]
MHQVIENYESLSAITAKMRDAATHGEWDTLLKLEGECRQRVEIMKAADDDAPTLSETSRQQKAALIRQILADDAVIRSHTEPWMAQLQRVMRNTKVEQRVRQSYSGQ